MNTIREVYDTLKKEMERSIFGQEEVISQILTAVFAGGHVLLEGVPGTGKTLLARSLARILGLEFRRIQFTPDLMPSDITGTSVFDLKSGNFYFRAGPVFANLVLADEINRTPPKTQSALLEAMEENQVTVDGEIRPLPAPFVVLATQNPVEYQGTYPLPEAQLDRFMMKIIIDYPPREAEQRILMSYGEGLELHDLDKSGAQSFLTEDIFASVANEVNLITVDNQVTDYILDIIAETREEKDLYLGASPRAAINLLKAAKILAAMRGRTFLSPDEVKDMCKPVLRHRLVAMPEAEVEGISTDHILEGILARVKVPR